MTPERIFNAFKNKEMDKETAKNYLISFVEDSVDLKTRRQALEFLGGLSLPNKDIFKFLEQLLISDESDEIRTIAAIMIVKNHLDEGEAVLKWAFENEKSAALLISGLKELEAQSKESLVDSLTAIISKKFIDHGMKKEDAVGLGLLERILEDDFFFESFGIGGLVFIEQEKGSVISISCSEEEDISPCLKFFKSLESLDLSDGNMTKIIRVEGLTSLKALNLGGNKILEISGLDGLPNLRDLYLGGNKIKEIKNLDNLANLRELDLGGNQIKEVKNLEKLANLKHLYLQWNDITEIKGLDGLTNLKSLGLNHNKITEINGLNGLSNLRALNLSENGIKEVKNLDKLVNLEELDLSHNPISSLKSLGELPNLSSLRAFRTNILEMKGLDKFDATEDTTEALFNIFERPRRQINAAERQEIDDAITFFRGMLEKCLSREISILYSTMSAEIAEHYKQRHTYDGIEIEISINFYELSLGFLPEIEARRKRLVGIKNITN